MASTPTPDRVIIDVGRKTFSSSPPPYGLVLGVPEVSFYAMPVEHGNLSLGKAKRRSRLGEKLAIMPASTEKLVNLYDGPYGVRNSKVEAVWRIARRGKSR